MNTSEQAFSELDTSILAALETYSNVHRGSGHFSEITTHLFDKTRSVVLQYLGLPDKNHHLIYCTTARAARLKSFLRPGSFYCISSEDIGLPIGVTAIAVKRKMLPGDIPPQTGGGTARLVSPGPVVWAKAPDKFEAGTPAIINIIAFARALQLCRSYGGDIFTQGTAAGVTPEEIVYRDEFDGLHGKELLVAMQKVLIGRNVLVPTSAGLVPFTNLDNSASTPTFTPVFETFRQVLRLPSREIEKIPAEVQPIAHRFFDASPLNYEIIFTSNTTEAINIAAENVRKANNSDYETVIVNTIMEHNSNELPWRHIPGCSIVKTPVSPEGIVDVEQLKEILENYNRKKLHSRKRVKLVAITGASNVHGTYNNLETIGGIVHEYEASFLVDGAQLAAHRKISIDATGIDFFAFSAHKIYAPFGSGMLLARKNLLNLNASELELLKHSGEENAAGIAALGKALLLLQRVGMDVIREEELKLTRQLLTGIKQIPGSKVYGIQDETSPDFTRRGGVISFSVKGNPHTIARLLAERGGIGVRSGCHCAHMLIKHLLKIPPALQKFQHVIVTLFPKVELPGVLRVSIGMENTSHDIEAFLNTLTQIADKTGVQEGRRSTGNIKNEMKNYINACTERVFGHTAT
jgi:selenocysteine lyase/cysteine desulfurase